MANTFLDSFNKANKKLSAKDFKSKTGKGGYYPAKKNLILGEITKLNKVLKKDRDNKEAFYAKDSLLDRLDFVEESLGLPEAKTPLSQEGEVRKMQKKAAGGKVYTQSRNKGGSIRKPRTK